MTDGHVVVRRRAIQRSVAHAYRAGGYSHVGLDPAPTTSRIGGPARTLSHRANGVVRLFSPPLNKAYPRVPFEL